MRFLHKMDDFLVDGVAQPVSDYTAVRFALGHLQLARLMFHLTAILILLKIGAFLLSHNPYMRLLDSVASATMLYPLSLCIRNLGPSSGIGTPSMALPAERLRGFQLRLLMILFSIISIIIFSPDIIGVILFKDYTPGMETFYSLMAILIFPVETLGFYFTACRSNPPGLTRKVFAPQFATQNADS
jgi:hypothetical protein